MVCSHSNPVGMEERTGLARLAGTLFIEFAWNMSGTLVIGRTSGYCRRLCVYEDRSPSDAVGFQVQLTLVIGRTAGTVECSAHMRTVPYPILWASRYR